MALIMERYVIEHFEDRIRKKEYLNKQEERELPEGAEGRLLEIGCGARLTYVPKTDEVCGIDISFEMARHFSRNNPDAQIIVGDARALPFRNESFHVIVMNMVIHHLVGRTPQKSAHNALINLKESKRILEKTGLVFIIELLARNYLFTLLMFYVTVLLAKLGININFLDIHSKVVTFFHTDRGFRKIATDAGFTIRNSEKSIWKLLKLKLGYEITYNLVQSTSQM